MNCLVLFSGTGSIEKVLEKYNVKEIRGLDIENKFKPYYNVDILKWDYKKEFETFIPDYIHGSPVCKEFSNLKFLGGKRDMGLGMSLLSKTLEIIEYVKTINPDLKYTLENPKGLMRKSPLMKPYKRLTVSYCKYGYPYQKHTDIWYGGFELKLKDKCCKGNYCDFKREHNYHQVRVGLSHLRDVGMIKRSGPLQIGGVHLLKQMKQDEPEKYKGWTTTHLYYRIPEGLIIDIVESLHKHQNTPSQHK